MKRNLLVDLNLVTFHTYFTVHEEKTKEFTIKNTTLSLRVKPCLVLSVCTEALCELD